MQFTYRVNQKELKDYKIFLKNIETHSLSSASFYILYIHPY